MNPNQLQAMFARRREQEHNRIERTQELSRYYDHFGNVNRRFQSWNSPEYYRQAEEQLKQQNEKKDKQAKLEQRRNRLRALLAAEKEKYDEDQRELEKPRSRRLRNVSTEMLHKIDQKAKETENIKRKLELEAKLYGKWRHGVDDEGLLFESKSENQVLAKLNWLDKQIDEQREREKQEAAAQERNLRLQEEINKTIETQKQRQEIREHEIREIRALQERHVEELKQSQEKTEKLKEQERQLRAAMREIERELELVKEIAHANMEVSALSEAYNLKKIKVFIRKRSEFFRDQIKTAISILERVEAYTNRKVILRALLDKYKDQFDREKYRVGQIESMYESEAKSNLQGCEELWSAQQMERSDELHKFLRDEHDIFEGLLEDNIKNQESIIEVRSTYLSSIENSNEKLKQLIKEQEESERKLDEKLGSVAWGEISQTGRSDDGTRDENANSKPPTPRLAEFESNHSNVSFSRSATPRPMRSSVAKVSDSFSNLNMNSREDNSSAGQDGVDALRIENQRAMRVVTPENVEPPRFGRKRVVW